MSRLPDQKSNGHRARKRFGQNFLIDQGVIAKIVSAIGPRQNQHLVEIGPGLGALTLPLAESGAMLTAVELDRDLVERLKQDFRQFKNLQLVCGDALKLDFAEIFAGEDRLRIVGNLPYNISTPLIFHLLKFAARIQDMHFMLQKEVVDRMAAQPGASEYGRLSVMVQYHCRVRSLLAVPAGSFDPQPRVHSAVVQLHPTAHDPVSKSEACLDRIVRAAFNNRRKTVRNCLRAELSEEQILQQGIDPGLRPENLSVQDYVKLANCLCGMSG